MSGKLITISTTGGKVALAAATAKTVLQWRTNSGTNYPKLVTKMVSVTFDGVSTVAQPVEIRLMKQTTDGTGTGVTPVAVQEFTGSILAVGYYNFTVEPSYSDVHKVWMVHPQSGYEIILPLGLEQHIPPNTRAGLVVTAPAVVNCHATWWAEE